MTPRSTAAGSSSFWTETGTIMGLLCLHEFYVHGAALEVMINLVICYLVIVRIKDGELFIGS